MSFKIWFQLFINKLLDNSNLNRKLDALLEKKSHMDPAGNNLEHVSGYVDKGTQILLALKYRDLYKQGVLLPFEEVQFRNHSQNGEDGILWNIFSLVGTTNKKAVEICAGNGKECNTANLVINHGWHVLMVEGDKTKADFAKAYYGSHPDTYLIPPVVVNDWITAENANDVIRLNGFAGEIDFLSIDVDGIDYWLWKAIDAAMPRVVMVEIQCVWRCTASVTVPYSPDFICKYINDPKYGLAAYGGASLPAFVKLAREKGYRLIGANRHGFNVVFMRNDVGADIFPEIDPENVFCNTVSNWIYDRAKPLYEGLKWEEV
jgi:hypothetical protein